MINGLANVLMVVAGIAQLNWYFVPAIALVWAGYTAFAQAKGETPKIGAIIIMGSLGTGWGSILFFGSKWLFS